MGNVLAMAPLIAPLVSLTAASLPVILRPNPTFADIQARQRAEEVQRAAERAAKEAQQLVDQIRRQANQDREEARVRQQEFDRAAAQAVAAVERMKVLIEGMDEAAKLAKERAEESCRASKNEAEVLSRDAQEERERAEKVREDAVRAMEVAREESEMAKTAADEQRREAERARVLAEEVACNAAEEIRKAIEAKEEAERCLREGIQLVVTPTLAAAKHRVQYKEDYFHFAIAGVSGSGKSSLVNAFRGLRCRDAGAAAVGVTETTLQMTRYEDRDPENPFVWYDIPGAGTLKCRDWQYFNDQGLYVFDCIIVLFDNRFTATDIAILLNARQFNIPTYIVRSKADQHIHNVMIEMGYESGEVGEGGTGRRNKLYKAARKKFVEETRKSVRDNLKSANLPDQRVYIISSTTMLSMVLNKKSKKTIDEVDLASDLLNQAYSRRAAQLDEMVST